MILGAIIYRVCLWSNPFWGVGIAEEEPNRLNTIKILTERRTESSILRFEKNNGNFGAAKPLPGLLPNLWKQERSNLVIFLNKCANTERFGVNYYILKAKI